jgi:dihydrofolate synthase / folylpolyglutamate synthase
MTLTYQETLAYLYSLANYERIVLDNYSPTTLNLERVRDLLAALGNPHERYKTIHVAGTKGKGSTAAMLTSCLQQLNLKVGLYTSPHLTTFRERIQVNGEMISRDDVVSLAEKVKALSEHIPGVTTFEAITAMGFQYFADQNVDWVVVEVGLGGRLDATNVITPQVSVITSLSYDHTKWLGNTLTEIAAEKAGIIKPGVPVVSSTQPLEATTVIERIAHERNAPLIMLGRHWRWTPGATSLDKQSFEVKQVARVRSKENPFVNDLEGWYEIPLLGKHQLDNATTVIATLDTLRSRGSGLEISAHSIRDGLRMTRWPGRFEILRSEPPLIADGAHNIDSVNKLAVTLVELFPGKRWVVVFGCYIDKDADGIMKAMGPRTTRWIMTQVDNTRAMPVEQLLDLARVHHLKAIALPNVLDAMDAVINSNDAVCITGSVALVGAARAVWARRSHGAIPDTDD